MAELHFLMFRLFMATFSLKRMTVCVLFTGSAESWQMRLGRFLSPLWLRCVGLMAWLRCGEILSDGRTLNEKASCTEGCETCIETVCHQEIMRLPRVTPQFLMLSTSSARTQQLRQVSRECRLLATPATGIQPVD